MMRRLRWYALFGILFLICLAVDATAFGALAGETRIGAMIADSARVESPLAHTYIVIGRPLVALSPIWEKTGRDMADAAFGTSYPAILATPDAAITLLFAQSYGVAHAWLLLTYWGAPLFLLLTIIAWLLRTRSTHLIKSARR